MIQSGNRRRDRDSGESERRAPPARLAPSAHERRWSVRAWAIALPIVAVLAGRVTVRVRPLAAIVRLAGLGVPLAALLLARVGRVPRTARREGLPDVPPSGPSRSVTVVIPARDEAIVVGMLLRDLALQDLRGPDGRLAFDVVVIDDRSSDGTGACAREAIVGAGIEDRARVVRRASGPDGKGAALAWLGPVGSETTLVLDADARIATDVIRRLVDAVTGSGRAATARRRMLSPIAGRGRHLLARLQDDEMALDGAVQLARAAMGGGSELRGNGMVVPADVLAAVGGWPDAAVTEDLELSTRLYLRTGRGVDWLPAIEVWEQPVLRLDHLARQRLRWAEGAIRRDIGLVLPSLRQRRATTRQRADLVGYAGHLLLGWYLAGLATSGTHGRHLAGTVVAGYGVATVALAADALRRFADPAPSRPIELFGRAVGVTMFAAAWLPVTSFAWLLTAVRGDSVRFDRTLKSAEFVRTT